MAPRSSWKGFLNLSLVSVPVRAYSASDSSGTIRLNQLCSECNCRVKYQTACPTCGEISRSAIVKGYEYAKDQYVVIDLDELEKLRPQDEGKAIRIDCFISPQQLDPVYFSDTSYYLIPDGVPGQRPYALFVQAMEEKELMCVARIVMHNKDQLVVVRVVDGLLCMTSLRYASQIKPTELFKEDLVESDVSQEEYRLAERLIDDTTREAFAIEDYQDTYTERLSELVQIKVDGKEIVAAPTVDAPPVINLMDALKASVESAKQGSSGAPLKKKVAKKKTKKKATKKTSSSDKALTEKLAAKKPRKTTKRKKKTG